MFECSLEATSGATAMDVHSRIAPAARRELRAGPGAVGRRRAGPGARARPAPALPRGARSRRASRSPSCLPTRATPTAASSRTPRSSPRAARSSPAPALLRDAAKSDAIETALKAAFPDLARIDAPGTVDAGDVCDADGHFLIGLSARTNEAGATQLAGLLDDLGYRSDLIDIRAISALLHLKSGITYLGEGRLLAIRGPAAPPCAGCLRTRRRPAGRASMPPTHCA